MAVVLRTMGWAEVPFTSPACAGARTEWRWPAETMLARVRGPVGVDEDRGFAGGAESSGPGGGTGATEAVRALGGRGRREVLEWR